MQKQIILLGLFFCVVEGLRQQASSPTVPFNGEGLILGMTYNIDVNATNNIFFADPKTGEVKHRDEYTWVFLTLATAVDDVNGWYYIFKDYTLWQMNYTTGVIMRSVSLQFFPLTAFYDPINNRIVGLFMDSKGNSIGSIDVNTGAINMLVKFDDMLTVPGDGYTYDQVDQVFYMNVESGNQNWMYVFDLKENKIASKLPIKETVQAVQVDRHSSSIVSLIGVGITSNSLVRIDTKTGQFTILQKVVGIPANEASAVDNANGRYYLQVINYQNQYWLVYDTKTGSLLSKSKTVDTWTHIFLLNKKSRTL